MPSKAQVEMSRTAQWKRLAQGAALLDTPPLEGARSIPLDRIDPNPQQARQVFDEAALAELAASIREHGVLEPILVRPVGTRYQVVAGERRTRAARLAGLESVPAIIRADLSDLEAATITALENLQREDLDLADEVRWLVHLQALTGTSGRDLSEQVHKGRSWVARRLRLAGADDTLFTRIRRGELTIDAAIKELDNPPDVARDVPELAPDSTPSEGWAIDPQMDSPASAPQPERATPPARVSRAELDSAPPPPPVPVKWKQFHEWLTARSIPPPVAPSARALLREQIDEVMKGLKAWRADLED